MPPEDGELIQRINHSDLNAFDELFQKHQNSVYRFACYLTQNRVEADDLFQETWLRAVKYLPTSSSIRNFKAWILIIVVNLHRDELRRKKIRKIFSPIHPEHPNQENAHLENLQLEQLHGEMDESDQVDIGLALNEAIAALPLKQRRVFILKEIEGLKHSEIAEILGAPVGTIKSLLHKAIKKLQRELYEFRKN